MTNFARDIKDLSIALEALARIQGTEDYYSRIKRVLDNRINQMETEDRYIPPTHPRSPDDVDDEIPF